MHHNAPDKTQAIPLINPPNMNQQIFPNNRMNYILPSLCFEQMLHEQLIHYDKMIKDNAVFTIL